MIGFILIFLIPISVIVVFAFIISFIYAFIHRMIWYKKIKQICKEKNYKIVFPRKLLASFFKYSDKPDVIIETPDENYLVRFITCAEKSLFYNFPTAEWYVSFERILSYPINPTGRFKHLPRFDEKYNSENGSVENKYIMVFAPKMPKISYLNANNSERKMAGTLTKIEEWTIYDFRTWLEKLEHFKCD